MLVYKDDGMVEYIQKNPNEIDQSDKKFVLPVIWSDSSLEFLLEPIQIATATQNNVQARPELYALAVGFSRYLIRHVHDDYLQGIRDELNEYFAV